MTPTFEPIDFHDIRTGRTGQLWRDQPTDFSKAIEASIGASNDIALPVLVADFRFLFYADVRRAYPDGNALLRVEVGDSISGPELPLGTPLYTGVAAAQLATAPLAWRCLVRDYLRAAASSPRGSIWGALGPMPRRLPWVAGFYSNACSALVHQDRETLDRIIEDGVRGLLLRCEAGVKKSVAEGHVARLDPDEFHELQDEG